MSRDIRSFFTSVGGSKKKDDDSKLPVSTEKKGKSKSKRKIVLSDSDDDVIITSSVKKIKKQSIVLADSDDDDIITSSVKKQKKQDEKQSQKVKKTPPKKKVVPELKAVNIMDVFGGGKIKRSTERTHSEKKTEIHKDLGLAVTFEESDLDFENTLQDLDVDVIANKVLQKNLEDNQEKETKASKEKLKVEQKEQEARSKQKLEDEAREKIKHDDETKKSRKKETKTKSDVDENIESKPDRGKLKKEVQSKKMKLDMDENIESKPDRGKLKNEVQSKIKSDMDKNIESKPDRGKVTPKLVKKDPKVTLLGKEVKSSKKDTTVAESETTTLSKDVSLQEDDEDEPSWVNDPAEKKRLSAIGYQQYLNREGPKNLGKKEIPQGKPDCLKGIVFVVTGVLDSMEREAAVALIQECGGKVTTSVSRKTSYIVLGEDAGPSKVHKAKQFRTRELDEDGLLNLVRTKSGMAPLTKTEQSPKKNRTGQKNAANNEGKHEESTSITEKVIKPKVKDKTPIAVKSPKMPVEDVENKSPVRAGNLHGKPSNRAIEDTETCITSDQSAPLQLPTSLLWVDKYRPMTTKQIIGQQGENSNVKKLTKWLQNWNSNQFGGKKLVRPSPWARGDDGAFFKAALLSGPPGVGKTTTAHLVCKELGLDVVEFNASDTRSKKMLHDEVSELLSSKSLYQFFRGGGVEGTSTKHVLLMDEVDGMAGNEDRGGLGEINLLIKSSKIPIICMCNDVSHMKMRTLTGNCFDLRFTKPRVEQIRGAMLSVCFKEGVKMSPDALNNMIVASSQDVRQVLHHLALYTAKESSAAVADNHDPAKQLKNIKLGPWDVLKRVFSAEEHKKMTINDKSDLFFHDYSMSPLFVQENYLSVTPDAAKNNIYKRLDLLAAAADSICYGDIVDKLIRSKQAWSLLPAQAMYSSVIPGDILEGNLTAQINFPSWLGKNSRRGKFDRLLQELHVHTRLSVSGSKQSLNMDYLPFLRDGITRPLVKRGSEGVADAVRVMESYHLVRADLDSILELSLWPKQKDPMSGVDSKVKSAFTRTFNKESAMLPYSTAAGFTKKVSLAIEGEEYEDEGAEDDREENEDDVTTDAMIVAKKRPASKKEPVAGGSLAKKARGAGTSGRGRGKGKTK